ncbi:hypothetical protein ACQPXB_22680 [Amycolatopsis sp. CA-161197]|uniref:hypothetical protein n=1 Tax=unclassified Amycolatopsis TaxID=2618356 RepID=UPI0034547781
MPTNLSDLGAPQSVAELAADPDRVVAWSATLHRWPTAEREFMADGRHDRLRLTPVDDQLVAVIIWVDEP